MTAASDLRQILQELRRAKQYATRQQALGRAHAHLLDGAGMLVGSLVLLGGAVFLGPVLSELPIWDEGPRGTAEPYVFGFLLAALLLSPLTRLYTKHVRRRFGTRLPPPWGTDLPGGVDPAKDPRLKTIGRWSLGLALLMVAAGVWLVFQTSLRGAAGAALVATVSLMSGLTAARRGDRVGTYENAFVFLASPGLAFLPFGILTSLAVSVFLYGLVEALTGAIRLVVARREDVA